MRLPNHVCLLAILNSVACAKLNDSPVGKDPASINVSTEELAQELATLPIGTKIATLAELNNFKFTDLYSLLAAHVTDANATIDGIEVSFLLTKLKEQKKGFSNLDTMYTSIGAAVGSLQLDIAHMDGQHLRSLMASRVDSSLGLTDNSKETCTIADQNDLQKNLSTLTTLAFVTRVERMGVADPTFDPMIAATQRAIEVMGNTDGFHNYLLCKSTFSVSPFGQPIVVGRPVPQYPQVVNGAAVSPSPAGD